METGLLFLGINQTHVNAKCVSWCGNEPFPLMYQADILTLWVVMSLCKREIRVLLIVTCHADFDLLFSEIIDPCFHAAVNDEQPTFTPPPAPPTFSINTAHKYQYSAVLWLPTRQRLFQLDKEADIFNEMKSLVQSTSCKIKCYLNLRSAYLNQGNFAAIRCTFVKKNISILAVLNSKQHALWKLHIVPKS